MLTPDNRTYVLSGLLQVLAMPENTAIMGMLVSQTISDLNNSQSTADLDSCVRIASDLLKKTSQANYFSEFKEIDDEHVTEAERKQLQNALLDALGRNTDPRWVAFILLALGSGKDPSLRDFWLRHLATYLDAMKVANAVLYSALVALDHLGEPVFEGASSRCLADVERNFEYASKYLRARGANDPGSSSMNLELDSQKGE